MRSPTRSTSSTLSELPLGRTFAGSAPRGLEAGADPSALTSAHLAEIDRLVTDWHGQLRIELPGGVACVRVGDALTFTHDACGRLTTWTRSMSLATSSPTRSC